MRFRSSFLLALIFLVSASAAAQQAPQRDPRALLLAAQAMRALTDGLSVNDATLSGKARRLAGSDEETGTAVLKALAAGQSRMDLKFPSGSRSEARATSSNGLAGSWSGPDGVSHGVSHHNLMTDPTWFFPTFVLGRALSDSRYGATYVGRESKDSAAVEHLAVSQPFAAPSEVAAMVQHLGQTDIYLDSSTLLPVAVTFNTHPDKDAGLDITVEIRFSDYRTVGGAQVPFHVQRYLNHGLILDLQFETAALNTGLTASAFNVL